MECQALWKALYISSTLATLHTVSFLIEGSQPLPDQLPWEHTGPPSHMMAVPLLSFGLFTVAFTHTLTHVR